MLETLFVTPVRMLHFTRNYKGTLLDRLIVLTKFVPNLLKYTCANNHFDTGSLAKVIAKMKRCNFLPRRLDV